MMKYQKYFYIVSKRTNAMNNCSPIIKTLKEKVCNLISIKQNNIKALNDNEINMMGIYWNYNVLTFFQCILMTSYTYFRYNLI